MTCESCASHFSYLFLLTFGKQPALHTHVYTSPFQKPFMVLLQTEKPVDQFTDLVLTLWQLWLSGCEQEMQLLLVCFVPQPFPCECTPPTVIMMYLSIKESVSTIQVWTYQPGWPEYPWEIDTEDERKACSLFCRMMN